MIDIYPVQKKHPSKKRAKSFSYLIKYAIGLTLLVILVYFSLGYVNTAIDNWLKLKPIAMEKKPQTKALSNTTSSNNKLAETLGTEADLAQETNNAQNQTIPDSQTSTSAQFQTPPATQTQASESAPTQEQPAETKPVEINKSAIKIRVLNGNGIWKAAQIARDLLVKDGFKVLSTGNADNRKYETTLVYFHSGKTAEADLVLKTLESKYQVSKEENNTLTKNSDVLVVIGKK